MHSNRGLNLLRYKEDEYKFFTRISLEYDISENEEIDTNKRNISINLRFIDAFKFLPLKLSFSASGLKEFSYIRNAVRFQY